MSIEEDRETALIRSMIEELPADCSNCKKTAHVTAAERSRGRWDCYSCGTINRWPAKEKS